MSECGQCSVEMTPAPRHGGHTRLAFHYAVVTRASVTIQQLIPHNSQHLVSAPPETDM